MSCEWGTLGDQPEFNVHSCHQEAWPLTDIPSESQSARRKESPQKEKKKKDRTKKSDIHGRALGVPSPERMALKGFPGEDNGC